MAVSVKDFLDAIRGRYQDEPNKVEVTGSIVEYTMANQVEIRESDSVDFNIPSDLLKKCKDLEIYITDTHMDDDNFRKTIPMRVGFLGDFSTIVKSGKAYKMLNFNITQSSVNYFIISTKRTTNRPGGVLSFENIPLSNVFYNGGLFFGQGGSSVTEVSEEINRNKLYDDFKKAMISQGEGLSIRYEEVPTSGSITIKLKGWTI